MVSERRTTRMLSYSPIRAAVVSTTYAAAARVAAERAGAGAPAGPLAADLVDGLATGRQPLDPHVHLGAVGPGDSSARADAPPVPLSLSS